MKSILHPADIQDRDGGLLLPSTLFGLYPFLKTLFADGGYQGPRLKKGVVELLAEVDVEIVKRSDTAKGFEQQDNVSANSTSGGVERSGRFVERII